MDQRTNAIFERASLADQALDALKKEIFSGALKPGDRIDISEYAERWSVSTTPLRDALKSLESNGIVEVAPRRGVFVSRLDADALREIFEVRICLEGSAIRLATHHIPHDVAVATREAYLTAGEASEPKRTAALEEVDFLIHRVAKDYCGNSRLQLMMDSVWDLFQWSRHTIIQNVSVPFIATLPEHIRICDCLVEGDGDGAEKAMRDHLENTFERVSRVLGEKRA